MGRKLQCFYELVDHSGQYNLLLSRQNLNPLTAFSFKLPFEFKIHFVEILLIKVNYKLFVT